MLEFTCSSCGKRVQGDESLAGQRVQRPACNADMTAPSQSGAVPLAAIAAADHVGQAKVTPAASDGSFREGEAPLPLGPSRREMPGLVARWVPYGVVGVIVLIGFGLFIPAVRKAREAAARAQSTNNLKQIGMSFQAFHDKNKRLPFNGTKRAVGGDDTTGSWAFMIMQFEQVPMFADADDTNWGCPFFICPGRGRPSMCTGGGGPGAWTDYFINPFINSPNGVPNAPDAKRTLAGITDGTSNTIVVGHGQINPDDYASPDTIAGFTDIIFNGGSPGLCRPNRTVVNSRDASNPPSAAGNWGGPFAEGSLMCLLDGTVRFFPYTITGGTIVNGMGPPCNGCGDVPPPCSMASFLTPSGGEGGHCPD